MGTELYRQTKFGDSLVSALEELVDSDKIAPDLAIKVLSESYLEAIRNNFKARTTFKGKLLTFNEVEDVRSFTVKGVTFKTNFTSLGRTTTAPEVFVDKVRIVAIDAKSLAGGSTEKKRKGKKRK